MLHTHTHDRHLLAPLQWKRQSIFSHRVSGSTITRLQLKGYTDTLVHRHTRDGGWGGGESHPASLWVLIRIP